MKKPKPAVDHEARNRIAEAFMLTCAVDLSRDLSSGRMALTDAGKGVTFISHLSYLMADAMLKARDAK
jgi:hypothetical protein